MSIFPSHIIYPHFTQDYFMTVGQKATLLAL
jgi:hypothetical protein